MGYPAHACATWSGVLKYRPLPSARPQLWRPGAASILTDLKNCFISHPRVPKRSSMPMSTTALRYPSTRRLFPVRADLVQLFWTKLYFVVSSIKMPLYMNAKVKIFLFCFSLEALMSLRSALGGLSADKKFWQLLSKIFGFQVPIQMKNCYLGLDSFKSEKWLHNFEFWKKYISGTKSALGPSSTATGPT